MVDGMGMEVGSKKARRPKRTSRLPHVVGASFDQGTECSKYVVSQDITRTAFF